jgi:dTDP-4-dehydrorhamnose 3,5-epimerase
MIQLLPDLQAQLAFETYPDAPAIEGVSLTSLRKHRSSNGWFMEFARFGAGVLEGSPTNFEMRQTSVSFAEAGRINAFHIHTKKPQNEIWTVIHGQLLVWLVDCRHDSSTPGLKRSVVLSGEQPMHLHIPAGVAHGYKAGSSGAMLLYAMDQQFDITDPNEGRLPWDVFGAALWDEDKG